MTAASTKQWHVYLAEMAVVVFGILIAFQVEEWREGRQGEQDMRASLQRLAEETQQNLVICERREPVHREVAVGVEQAFLSLRSGMLQNKAVSRFESGLARAAELPNFTLQVTVADEMISTGILKEIGDDKLRQAIAGLRSHQDYMNSSYSNRRASVRGLSNALYDYIEIDFVDPDSVFGSEKEFGWSLEARTRVLYDFEQMASDKRLVNFFFEALDSHADLLNDIERICGSAASIDDLLKQAISN
jgi:hypothetical protein